MKHVFRRFFGLVLAIFSAIGLLLFLLGIFAVWKYKPPAEEVLNSGLELLDTTLSATREGLTLADQSLDTASTSMETLETTVDALSLLISNTVPLADSMSLMMGEELPGTIRATQLSLDSAQSSARIIDNVLIIVSSIPFFPGEPYNPAVPLNVSLRQVSESLDPLPAAFQDMESNLASTSDNLEIMKAEIALIARDIHQISKSLEESQNVIAQYQQVTALLQSKLKSLQKHLSTGMDIAAWVFTVILVWLAITQVGLLAQGFEMLSPVMVVEKPVEKSEA